MNSSNAMMDTTTNAIRILIADDHCLVRDAIATVLTNHGGFSVTSTDSFAGALELMASEPPFDIILLDIVMPGMDGITSVQRAINASNSGSVVIFSGNANLSFVNHAIEIGSKGYIPKSMPIKSLSMTLRMIASGEVYIPLTLLTENRNSFSRESRKESSTVQLSELESHALKLAADGKTNKEIAWDMHLTEVTVKMHMRSICKKLSAKNRTHAAMMARQLGML